MGFTFIRTNMQQHDSDWLQMAEQLFAVLEKYGIEGPKHLDYVLNAYRNGDGGNNENN